MVGNTLCPAVHILGKGYCWPSPALGRPFIKLNLKQGSGPLCSIGQVLIVPFRSLPCLNFSLEKRQPRASNGQQYPLPCCAHFRFPKCVQQGRGYRWPRIYDIRYTTMCPLWSNVVSHEISTSPLHKKIHSFVLTMCNCLTFQWKVLLRCHLQLLL